jgi:phosphohistidine phosphatase
MRLYLVRHAAAAAKARKGGRPLTPPGRAAAARLARWLQSHKTQVQAIWHSPKLRAVQTARILAAQVKPAEGLVVRPDCKPLSRPGRILHDLERLQTDIMLVGHMPHLAKLASKMLGWKRAPKTLDLETAGMAVLEREAGEGWKLKLLLAAAVLTES